MAAYQYQLLPELAATEYDALKADIAKHGVLVPVELDQQGAIIDGHHRVRAWTELTTAGVGLPEYPRLVRQFDDEDSRIEHALKLNLQRRHLTREQLREQAVSLRARGWSHRRIADVLGVNASTAFRWLGDEATVANATVELPQTVIGKDGKERPANMPRPAVLATSAAEQQQAATVLRIAEEHLDLVFGETPAITTVPSMQRAAKEAQREQKREANRVLVADTVGLREYVAGEVFSTLVLDPPWDWGDEGDADQFGRARPTYDTMTIDEITALPISDVTASNAHIYLWITNRSLPKGFQLLDAWGFRYVTTLTWCKPSIGMGNYFRGSTEHVLFGVRGSKPLLRRDLGTWFQAPREGQHSTKPQSFYELVEAASEGPWLELFSRVDRPGWVRWGAEAA